MSCLLVAQLAHPGSAVWVRMGINIELVYWCTTIAINILLTILIVAHLMQVRRKSQSALGSQAQVPYLSISAMLVEAAFLYTAFGLVFLVPYTMGSAVGVLFFSLMGQIQVCECFPPRKNIF